MDGVERLYYALGELAYAVAKADGKVNLEERRKLHDIVVKESKCHNHNLNISEIIFHIHQKERIFNEEDLYKSAMKEIKICSNYLTDDMKAEFVAVLDKVARAFDSITAGERDIIERFRKDIDKV